MRIYFTLVRREMGSFFASLTGYLIIAIVALLLGISFTVLLRELNQEPTDMPVTELFYISIYFWLILLLSAPVITMRSFALEKSTGTYETLMTTPVTDLAVVLAKFASAMLFYAIMWLPLLACISIVRHYSNDSSAQEAGPLASTFLGILLLGGLFTSMGCFASALTRNQIIAAIISFALGMALFFMSFLSLMARSQASWQSALVNQVAILEHMREFTRGVVDTRYLVFYLSLTVFFLFLTLKVVESRRWK